MTKKDFSSLFITEDYFDAPEANNISVPELGIGRLASKNRTNISRKTVFAITSDPYEYHTMLFGLAKALPHFRD